MRTIESATELEKLLKEDKAILLDFYADTCPPCQAIMPIVEKLAAEYEGKVDFQKVDVHKFPELRTKYGIGSIPTLLFVKKTEVVDKTVGVVAESVLVEKLNKLI
ncbi:thioredoxin family protein [Labilibaculum sp. DW002]|jgi:thioredoxin|uniref:Thioredoxin n=1 Tax=Paralabilibaculum antarcticum TaxID=2912572 RepID=A0ABT5VVP2_9BACT|nr:thioredoxin domain-containing protein [Labilibaculum sp. DW002]MDE5419486.1 thioredoxin family protein [Labilibaculum sp. DW002]|eukprot:TRINITY_DN103846_c0_g2_i1.p1 TRINITY_DN103846_c0_g2~~TRINITY_DN103846_c0_g2_i1.p1  ORF type:complete len:116 (+),score=18.70 TRINITY_DN103846_c0_g2_i1:35-349(+)